MQLQPHPHVQLEALLLCKSAEPVEPYGNSLLGIMHGLLVTGTESTDVPKEHRAGQTFPIYLQLRRRSGSERHSMLLEHIWPDGDTEPLLGVDDIFADGHNLAQYDFRWMIRFASGIHHLRLVVDGANLAIVPIEVIYKGD